MFCRVGASVFVPAGRLSTGSSSSTYTVPVTSDGCDAAGCPPLQYGTRSVFFSKRAGWGWGDRSWCYLVIPHVFSPDREKLRRKWPSTTAVNGRGGWWLVARTQVTELCTGGELFDRIIEKTESEEGRYSERDAARIVSSILSAIAYCHDEHNICHRRARRVCRCRARADVVPWCRRLGGDRGCAQGFHSLTGACRRDGAHVCPVPASVGRGLSVGWSGGRPPAAAHDVLERPARSVPHREVNEGSRCVGRRERGPTRGPRRGRSGVRASSRLPPRARDARRSTGFPPEAVSRGCLTRSRGWCRWDPRSKSQRTQRTDRAQVAKKRWALPGHLERGMKLSPIPKRLSSFRGEHPSPEILASVLARARAIYRAIER